MNKFESKFKPGEKVYHVGLNECGNMIYCTVSISIIDSVDFNKNGDTSYWLPPSDTCDLVEEENIIKYDKDELFKYLEENLKVQE